MFVVVKQRPETKQPELMSLTLDQSPTLERRMLPLFQVEIFPKRPGEQSHLTTLDFKVFAGTGQICWHVGA
jgi:hypothetical protein